MKGGLVYQIRCLVLKEFRVEWRNRYALFSILLLIIASVFIVYTIQGTTSDKVWHSFFYLMLIFGVVQNIGRSFLGETPGNQLYMKFMTDNRAVIASKILYQFFINFIFLCLLIVLMNFFLTQGINHFGAYFVTALLFTICNAAIFTFNAALSLGAKNSSLVSSVLSFPLLIPNLIVSLRSSQKCMLSIENVNFLSDWLVLIMLTAITLVLSIVLFRSIWFE